jgi:outer membrane protein, heavy metal efflux system
MFFHRIFQAGIAGLAALALVGCSLAPREAGDEKELLTKAGKPYELPFEKRVLPELPPQVTWRDVLQRAFLANGDLEATYYTWKIAVEQIGIDSAYPNTNLGVGFGYTFSSDQMKAFDRMSFSASPDTMRNLAYPGKVAQAGKIALDQARTTGEQFKAAKFALQEQVLSAWADYVLLVQEAKLQEEQVRLGKVALESIRAGVESGMPQEDLLGFQITIQTDRDKLAQIQAQIRSSRAVLNGLLMREPDAQLVPADGHVSPRPLKVDDAKLLAVAVDQNPQLAALSRQVEGRTDALELAKMQWIPDINPSFSMTGTATQTLGAVVMLPTTVPQIQGSIRQAQMMIDQSHAVMRQASRNRAAEFVATLTVLRDAQRQAVLFESEVVPIAARLSESAQQRYVEGAGTVAQWVEAQRALVGLRLVIVQSVATQDKQLAHLEALMGVDIETLDSMSKPAIAGRLPIETAALEKGARP